MEENKKSILTKTLLITGIACSVLSIAAIIASAVVSGDKSNLYKASLPVILIVLLASRFKKAKA